MFNVNDKITGSDDTQADALEVFKKAVNNGQTRLALEALVDVIDSIIDFLMSEPEEEEEEEAVEQKAPVASSVNVNAVEIKEENIEPVNPEANAPVKKKTKESTATISE
jgi:hypothetical protein